MKKYIIGFVFGAFLFSGLSTEAASSKWIEITHSIKAIFINGEKYAANENVFVHQGTTYVPIRFISETLGYDVRWDQATNTIAIGKGIGSDRETNTQSNLSAYESEIVNLVNSERQKAGLSPLKVNAALSKVARTKSTDMAVNNYFDHTSPTYGTPQNMLKQFGISYTYSGENIASGYQTPTAVMNGWMNSAGHRANILNQNYTEIGVGYDPSGNQWTQLFIKP